MKRYLCTDIIYDDDDGDGIDLPAELIVELDDDDDPDDELADAISNHTGWLVDSFNFEQVA